MIVTSTFQEENTVEVHLTIFLCDETYKKLVQ